MPNYTNVSSISMIIDGHHTTEHVPLHGHGVSVQAGRVGHHLPGARAPVSIADPTAAVHWVRRVLHVDLATAGHLGYAQIHLSVVDAQVLLAQTYSLTLPPFDVRLLRWLLAQCVEGDAGGDHHVCRLREHRQDSVGPTLLLIRFNWTIAVDETKKLVFREWLVVWLLLAYIVRRRRKKRGNKREKE
jgi:hypothetical protein